MSQEVWKETFEEQNVTYVLELRGKVLIIENVPAFVSLLGGAVLIEEVFR